MKKLLITAWVIFMFGLFLMFLHFPGGNFFLLLGTCILIIHSLIFLIKNFKKDLPSALLHISYSMITAYVLLRLLYRSFGPMILGYPSFFLFVLIVSILCFAIHINKKIAIKFPQILLYIYFVFFIVLSYTHSHRIYYFINLNTVMYEEERKSNFYAWDKYSWFLYISNLQDEALEANQNAQRAVEKYSKINPIDDSSRDMKLIMQHEKQIREKNWTTFR